MYYIIIFQNSERYENEATNQTSEKEKNNVY